MSLKIDAYHAPCAAIEVERVRVERPLLLLVLGDRPVAELHRPLLRDCRLELPQPAGELRRIIAVDDLDALGRSGPRLREARTAEGEVSQGEPERLRVREPALPQVEGPLQC